MKRLAMISGILALAAPLAMAQTSTWVSDQNHSEVDFSITHLAISNVHGRFGKVAATLVLGHRFIAFMNIEAHEAPDFHVWQNMPAHEVGDGSNITVIVFGDFRFFPPGTGWGFV